MNKKFNQIVSTLIGMGYGFNWEWKINTKSHTMENVKQGDAFVFTIDGETCDWPESVLNSVIVEL